MQDQGKKYKVQVHSNLQPFALKLKFHNLCEITSNFNKVKLHVVPSLMQKWWNIRSHYPSPSYCM